MKNKKLFLFVLVVFCLLTVSCVHATNQTKDYTSLKKSVYKNPTVTDIYLKKT